MVVYEKIDLEAKINNQYICHHCQTQPEFSNVPQFTHIFLCLCRVCMVRSDSKHTRKWKIPNFLNKFILQKYTTLFFRPVRFKIHRGRSYPTNNDNYFFPMPQKLKILTIFGTIIDIGIYGICSSFSHLMITTPNCFYSSLVDIYFSVQNNIRLRNTPIEAMVF